MLETVDLTRNLKKKQAQEAIRELSRSIGEMQRRLKDHRTAVVVVLEGWGASGRGGIANRLLLALDPRGYSFHYPGTPDTLPGRPSLLPFQRLIPPTGRIAVFGRSFYDRAWRGDADEVFLRDVAAFERQLADAGVLVIKAFLHISREEQTKRLKKRAKDPKLSWNVEPGDLEENDRYDERLAAAEAMLRATESENAPWTVIPATDEDYAAVAFLTCVRDAVHAWLERPEVPAVTTPGPSRTTDAVLRSSTITSLDYSGDMDGDTYCERLSELQERIHELGIEMMQSRLPGVVVFEGVDAAGKGGAIRRVTESLYPRCYDVIPIGAPTEWERFHPYLWRFWKEFPEGGKLVIFDRSWYGRVLVERVEGFCGERDWKRAYREINEMEGHLASTGVVIAKFWLQIDPDEQLRRFESRRDDPARSWKLTEEDWRNREKWGLYQEAASEMIVRTSTAQAPWTVVATNSKRLARVKVLSTIVDAVSSALGVRRAPLQTQKAGDAPRKRKTDREKEKRKRA